MPFVPALAFVATKENQGVYQSNYPNESRHARRSADRSQEDITRIVWSRDTSPEVDKDHTIGYGAREGGGARTTKEAMDRQRKISDRADVRGTR